MTKRELCGRLGYWDRTPETWGHYPPLRVRAYLVQAIRVRQLEQEVIRLQALLRERSQPIDSHQD